jgi:hypothetical protein
MAKPTWLAATRLFAISPVTTAPRSGRPETRIAVSLSTIVLFAIATARAPPPPWTAIAPDAPAPPDCPRISLPTIWLDSVPPASWAMRMPVWKSAPKMRLRRIVTSRLRPPFGTAMAAPSAIPSASTTLSRIPPAASAPPFIAIEMPPSWFASSTRTVLPSIAKKTGPSRGPTLAAPISIAAWEPVAVARLPTISTPSDPVLDCTTWIAPLVRWSPAMRTKCDPPSAVPA